MRRNGGLVRIVLWIAMGLVSILAIMAIILSANIIVNKNNKLTYDEIADTDKQMLTAVATYLTNSDGTQKDFSKPVIFMRDHGVVRSGGYMFNGNLTEHKLMLGLNGGTFATEMLLPQDMRMPSMYRVASLTPGLPSLLFPTDYSTINLCGVDTVVICYDENTLNNGEFNTLLDKALSE